MRGWSFLISYKQNSSYVLPAHAGVILEPTKGQATIERITRTCGGDPIKLITNTKHWLYYPHMRGWSYASVFPTRHSWVLPAHAGVIPALSSLSLRFCCITRTCGGDPIANLKISVIFSYYPHMRGWSSVYLLPLRETIVLPAHAGVILTLN